MLTSRFFRPQPPQPPHGGGAQPQPPPQPPPKPQPSVSRTKYATAAATARNRIMSERQRLSPKPASQSLNKAREAGFPGREEPTSRVWSLAGARQVHICYHKPDAGKFLRRLTAEDRERSDVPRGRVIGDSEDAPHVNNGAHPRRECLFERIPSDGG